MAYRPHGKARVDPKNPRAFGVDDRSGFLHNLEDLNFQYEWRGNVLQNTWFRVSAKNMDIPQQQLRPKNVPPDPVPVYQPRPENYAAANAGGVPIGGPATVPNFLISESGQLLTSDSTGDLLVADH